MNETFITYFGQTAKVGCDGKCGKAWGSNSRPKVFLTNDPEENPDNFYWLSDAELEIAPKDPGTYEGGEGKPSHPGAFPNKWCVRECERCEISNLRESHKPLEFTDWNKRVYNCKQDIPKEQK